jgi:hypothetical protein
MNQNGQQVLQKNFRFDGGSSTITLNRPSSIHAGIYIVQVTGTGIYENYKLVFQ